MPWARRWDPCIAHTGADVDAFVTDYFASADRKVLFVAGAGFDPRAAVVGTRLAQAGATVRALLIREERPNPLDDLVTRASGNVGRLAAVFADHEVATVAIFGSDNAVVGGRNAVSALHRQTFDGMDEVVIDVSALSVGTSFPLIRYLVERIEQGRGPANLHIFVAHEPALDEAIHPNASDLPGFVHGFRGGWALDKTAAAAKLWLPQLARGRRAALARLHDFVGPHDTCPILPFPRAIRDSATNWPSISSSSSRALGLSTRATSSTPRRTIHSIFTERFSDWTTLGGRYSRSSADRC